MKKPNSRQWKDCQKMRGDLNERSIATCDISAGRDPSLRFGISEKKKNGGGGGS
jgi:hypothetical protein